MALLLPVLIALVPLAILPGGSFYFDVIPKVVLALAAAAVAVVVAEVARGELAQRTKWFLGLLGIEAVTLIAATILSRHAALSFFGTIWRKDGLAVELSLLTIAAATYGSLCVEPARLRPLLRITVLGSIPAAIYGIAQYFGQDPWIPAAGYHFGEGTFEIVRPPATLGHAAYFASYLIFPLFGGLALRSLETSRGWRAAAWSASLLAGFAMVLSGTRAAVIASLAGALVVFLRDGFTAQRMARLAAGGAAALAVLGLFYFSPAGARLRARVHWSREDSLGGARLLLWRDTLRMSGAHWLRGAGPETFVVEFPAFESVELARAYPDFYHESPHNIFLDALVSQGVIGLAVLAGLALLGLSLARGAMGAAFVAMLLSQQFTSFTVPTELYFYLGLAILAAAPVGAADPVGRRLRLRWVIAAPFAGLAIFFAAGDAMLASAARALDRGEVAAATREVALARGWHATADIYFSRRFLAAKAENPALRLRAWESGFDAARHAPASADDAMNGFVNLAAFYAGENNAGEVERNLRAASGVAPNWYKPHWLLARVLALEGRRVEAASEMREAEACGAPRNPPGAGR